MNARLGRRPFALVWLLFVAVLAAGALASEPADEALRRAVNELSDPDFKLRERAAHRLLAAGNSSIEILAETLRSKDPEVAWRSAAVLLQIAVDGDDQAFRQAVAALRKNAHAGDSVDFGALRAKRMAKRRATAEASIRSLGGLFGSPPVRPPTADGGTLQQPGTPNQSFPPEEHQQPIPKAGAMLPPPDLSSEDVAALARIDPTPHAPLTAVQIADAYVSPELLADDTNSTGEMGLTLTKTWRGGDDGLTELRHLPEIVSVRLDHAPVSDLALSHISALPQLRDMCIIQSPFTPAALGRFRQRHPNVTVFVAELVPQTVQPDDLPTTTTTR